MEGEKPGAQILKGLQVLGKTVVVVAVAGKVIDVSTVVAVGDDEEKEVSGEDDVSFDVMLFGAVVLVVVAVVVVDVDVEESDKALDTVVIVGVGH